MTDTLNPFDTLEGPNAESAERRVNRSEAAQRAAKTVAAKKVAVDERGADCPAPAQTDPAATLAAKAD